MNPRSRRPSARLWPVLLLCFSLLGMTACAAMAPLPPIAAQDAGMDDMSAAMACAPCFACVTCCVAPTEPATRLGGDGEQPASPAWHVHQVPQRESVRWTATGDRYAAVPLRIALCRWLD